MSSIAVTSARLLVSVALALGASSCASGSDGTDSSQPAGLGDASIGAITGAVRSSMESDLKTVAISLESYYSTNGAYPASVADLPAVHLSAGNTVTLARNDGSNYCLDVANPSAPDVMIHYDSAAGGLADGRC